VPRAAGRVVEVAGVLALLAAFTAFLAWYHVPVFSGVDPNGYHVSARLFADTGRFGFRPEDDYSFVGRMWVVNAHGECYAKYPPLYPALAGLAIRAFGPEAGFAVNPVCAALAVLAVYFLGRNLGLGAWSLVAAASVALNPVFAFYAASQVSHASSLAFLAWGYAAFFLGRDRPPRARIGLSLVAGLLVGCAAGIRYTDVLLAAPLLFLAVVPWRRDRLAPALGLCAGFALPWSVLALYHWGAFGGVATTGYALTGEQPGFGWAYFRENLRFYLHGTVTTGFGPFGGLALAGLAWLGRRGGRPVGFFALWILPVYLLYVAYYWAPEARPAGFLRFVLPVLPPAALLGAWLLREAVGDGGRRGLRLAGAALAVALQLAWGWQGAVELVEPAWRQASQFRAVAGFVESSIPAGAVVFAPNDLANYLQFTRRFRLYPEELLSRARLQEVVRRALEPGPSGLQKARAQWLQDHVLSLPAAEFTRRMYALVDGHLAAGRPVYLAGSRAGVAAARAAFLRRYEIETAGEFRADAPAARLVAVAKPSGPPRRAALSGNSEAVVLRVVRPRLRPLSREEELLLLRRDLEERSAAVADVDPDVRARPSSGGNGKEPFCCHTAGAVGV
jgi:hypothetical protein